MSNKSYSEKLLDPRWQKKRLLIFERDDWTCQSCGATHFSLQVHHIKYFPGKEPWDYEDQYLVTYCEKCHNTDHLIGGELSDNLLEIVKENRIFVKPVAQISVLAEKWKPFYSQLRKFLNESMMHYLKSKADAKPTTEGHDR